MGQAVGLDRVAGGSCGENDCPTVFATSRGTLAIKGDRRLDVETADHEAVVEVPISLIREAMRALGG
jgi:hypothetical protein